MRVAAICGSRHAAALIVGAVTDMGDISPRASARTLICGIAAAAVIAGSAGPAAAHHVPDAHRQRNHIDHRARSQIGTPYRTAGSYPGGFDCSGFTRWVFAGHGADLPRTAAAQFELRNRPHHRRIFNRAHLHVGDLVFHRTTSARVGHVGIYVGDGRFISATSSQGVQIRSLYDPYYWGQRWVAGVRLPIMAVSPRDNSTRTGGERTEEPRPENGSRPI